MKIRITFLISVVLAGLLAGCAALRGDPNSADKVAEELDFQMRMNALGNHRR
jgi:hypothetical protein